MIALFLDALRAGSNSAARMPMMAITTSSSMSVKARESERSEQQRREGAKGRRWRMGDGAAMQRQICLSFCNQNQQLNERKGPGQRAKRTTKTRRSEGQTMEDGEWSSHATPNLPLFLHSRATMLSRQTVNFLEPMAEVEGTGEAELRNYFLGAGTSRNQCHGPAAPHLARPRHR